MAYAIRSDSDFVVENLCGLFVFQAAHVNVL